MRTNRYRRKKSFFPVIPVAIILIASFIAVYAGMNMITATVNGAEGSGDSIPKFSSSKIKKNNIYSKNVVLRNTQAKEDIYKKNGDEKCYPASLTKIMTALVAIEKNKNLKKEVVIDSAVINRLIVENASMAGYNPGELTSVEDLLYGCLLASGGDASVTLAQLTSGSENKFVELMNDKADELNLNNTHFTNTTGLHNDNHYTTAEDISRLLEYALKNKEFKKIFTAKSHNIKTGNREFTVNSTFFSEYKPNNKGYDVLGAKTGKTSAAGLCLATYINKNGADLVLVTINAPIGGGAQPFTFDDLDYMLKAI